MQLMRMEYLGANKYSTTRIIDNYSSLVWTERFDEPGDFVLTSVDIENTRTYLALNTLLTLENTSAVFIVESHLIERDEDGLRTITVRGRSAETFLEARTSASYLGVGKKTDTGEDRKTYVTGSAEYAVRKVIYDAMVLGKPQSPDAFAEIFNPVIQVDASTATQTWEVPLSDLYSFSKTTLKTANLALQLRRSVWAAAGDVNLYIISGRDRSGTVQLDTRLGHIANESYLWSTRDTFNGAYVYSDKSSLAIGLPGFGFGGSTKFNRRVMVVDMPNTDTTNSSLYASMASEGLKKVNEKKSRLIFSGEVTDLCPFKYREHFATGDIVRVRGEYGFNEKMRVTEYIRTQDEDGERAYPTLSQI